MSNKSFDISMGEFKVGKSYPLSQIEGVLMEEPYEHFFEDRKNTKDSFLTVYPGVEMEMDDNIRAEFELQSDKIYKCIFNNW